jgi:hypothetical protein
VSGRAYGYDYFQRVLLSFSNGHLEYENDWDFSGVEDEGGVKLGDDSFCLDSALL